MPELVQNIESTTTDNIEDYVPGPVEEFIINYLKEKLGIKEE